LLLPRVKDADLSYRIVRALLRANNPAASEGRLAAEAARDAPAFAAVLTTFRGTPTDRARLLAAALGAGGPDAVHAVMEEFRQ
jgi:hypothetical protein